MLKIDHSRIQIVTDIAAENEYKDSPTTGDKLTKDLDKVILQDEPCKSTTVSYVLQEDFFCSIVCLSKSLHSTF